MTKTTFSSALSETFKYDPSDRRIYKSSSAGTSVLAYDGDTLIEETNATGSVVARYSQGGGIDEPLAMLRSSATSYYHADGLGSITALSNGAGSLTQTYTFDSFGKQTASSGSLLNPFQYAGRESDAETGLYYYRARYYDSSIGRFISEDPGRFVADSNFYEYVQNNPTEYRDPYGLIHQAWFETPWDGRLHDDSRGGLEVLCTKGRNLKQDISWLEHSIMVRGVEIGIRGNDADEGHVKRFIDEVITLGRCHEECDKDKKPDPKEDPWVPDSWQQWLEDRKRELRHWQPPEHWTPWGYGTPPGFPWGYAFP